MSVVEIEIAEPALRIRAEPLRVRCRDPKCLCALPVPAEERRAFCARGCYDRFYRTRCRVCGELSPRGKLHARKCAYAHRQNPGLYAYRKLQNPADGRLSPERTRDERNPYKTAIKTRARTWGPALSTTEYWLGSLPLHPIDAARVRQANDPRWIWRETAWCRPKVLFGPDMPPLNLVGGYRFPGAPTVDQDGAA
jgi:hypothetical protein